MPNTCVVAQTSGLVYSGANNSSLQVFISAKQPPAGTPQLANWLPAPTSGAFQLVLRMYGPAGYVAAGQYEPPAVVPVTAAE